MKVICKKSITQMVRGINVGFIKFKVGAEYHVFVEEDGRDYIVNGGYKFYFHHYDPNFLECFDIIDDFTEEDMKEILEIMNKGE